MDGSLPLDSLPRDVARLQAMLIERDRALAERERVIGELTRQRDEFHIENLRLRMRLAQALKQAYGPRADRLGDPAQLMLDFAARLDALPVDGKDLPPAEKTREAASRSRRVRTRGRRDIGTMDHLPMIERVYELDGALCLCPTCQRMRERIGEEVTYTIEHIPASFIRIKHIQRKYACPACERNGCNPRIELAEKTGGSPIDRGMPGPGLLAYIVTAKFSDFLPLNRLQNIFAREGFELDRSTMCLWMADVARLVGPLYARMAELVLRSHVLATDDTPMPLLQPGKTKPARMWIYLGDESQPYNVFDFTLSRAREGPAQFLKDFREVLLADAYGGYDGIVVRQDLLRGGCWSHARRKFVDVKAAAPEAACAVVRLADKLFAIEACARDLAPDERLAVRQLESQPVIDALHAMLVERKAALLPKHPVAEAMGYVLNQWGPLTLFLRDGAVPIHNNLAEQQMKRVALLRKNSLFVATPNGGKTAAVLSSFTSTCRRHEVNPQAYLTQLLAHLPGTPIGEIDQWLPDRWKKRQAEAAPSR